MLNITIYPHRKDCKVNQANIAKGTRHADEQTQKIKTIVLHKHSENATGEKVKGSPNGFFTNSNQACVTAFWKQKHPKETKKPTSQTSPRKNPPQNQPPKLVEWKNRHVTYAEVGGMLPSIGVGCSFVVTAPYSVFSRAVQN